MFGWLQYFKHRREQRERILALDLLRGTFLIIIISTHSVWSPSVFSLVGGRGELFASAAEGFFAISGIMVGFIYGPKILKSTKKVFIKMWKRAGLLYVLSVVFTFFFSAWATLIPGTIKYENLYNGTGLNFILDTLTLQYAYGWADFLARYAVFMFVAPFAVWLVAKHKAWLVALISFLIWFFLRESSLFLPYSAWQIVFMYGIIIGFYLPQIEGWFLSSSKKSRKRFLGSLWVISGVSFVWSILWIQIIPYVATIYPAFSGSSFYQTLMSSLAFIMPYFNKDHLDPARILIGIIWFVALYSFYRVYEKQLNKYTFGILDTLGKNSLFVYCLHAFLLFFIDVFFNPFGRGSFIANTLVTALIIGIIYRMTLHKGIFARIRRKLLPSFSKEVIP